MLRFIVFFVFLCGSLGFSQDKVLIFTYAFNRPDFLEIQHATLKEYLLDEYEFVVFNDAKDPGLYKQIHQVCSRLNLSCVDMPQHLHQEQTPSARNAAIVNYSLNTLGFDYDGVVVLLDSDMFLVKDFSVKKYMEGYLLRGLPQVRSSENCVVDYFWVGIVFLDMTALPNKRQIDFSPGFVNGVYTDTGGCTHRYLSQNRDVELGKVNMAYTADAYNILKSCSCLSCVSRDVSPCKESLENLYSYGQFNDKQIQFIKESRGDNSEFYLDSHFFHYRCGSNWSNKENNYRYKIKAFNKYFKDFSLRKKQRDEFYARKK